MLHLQKSLLNGFHTGSIVNQSSNGLKFPKIVNSNDYFVKIMCQSNVTSILFIVLKRMHSKKTVRTQCQIVYLFLKLIVERKKMVDFLGNTTCYFGKNRKMSIRIVYGLITKIFLHFISRIWCYLFFK